MARGGGGARGGVGGGGARVVGGGGVRAAGCAARPSGWEGSGPELTRCAALVPCGRYFDVAWPAINDAKQRSQKAEGRRGAGASGAAGGVIEHPEGAPFGWRAAQGLHLSELRRFLRVCSAHALSDGERGRVGAAAVAPLLRAALLPLDGREAAAFLRAAPGGMVDAPAPA
eukprot:6480250-Prymnesium_polylepis.1